MSSIYDDDFCLPQLIKEHVFPSAREATQEGLLACGGDLNPHRILEAYSQGIFPWYGPDEPIMWWSPNPRLVLLPQDFKNQSHLDVFYVTKDLKFILIKTLNQSLLIVLYFQEKVKMGHG